jgi:hypothetical protein
MVDLSDQIDNFLVYRGELYKKLSCSKAIHYGGETYFKTSSVVRCGKKDLYHNTVTKFLKREFPNRVIDHRDEVNELQGHFS